METLAGFLYQVQLLLNLGDSHGDCVIASPLLPEPALGRVFGSHVFRVQETYRRFSPEDITQLVHMMPLNLSEPDGPYFVVNLVLHCIWRRPSPSLV